MDEEAEAWSERTAVITRYDHETNCQLARSFVEDLADKVVAENWKLKQEEEAEVEAVSEQVEEFKVPAKPSSAHLSLKLHKQSLFLPNLVPDVVVKPSLPPSESESDEYESADEHQTQSLHGNLIILMKVVFHLFNYVPFHYCFRYSLLRFHCQSFSESQRFYSNRYS